MTWDVLTASALGTLTFGEYLRHLYMLTLSY